MNTKFSYDNKDYYSILEYLKEQASLFSNNAWTDFSDGDIGTVLLKLMAMLADTTNYQLEKSILELYLDTVVERTDAIALCKLIGYEPRHYLSAHVSVEVENDTGSNLLIPRFTVLSNNVGSVKYYTLQDFDIPNSAGVIEAYEGNLVSLTYQYTDIDENGRLLLPDYNIGTNTLIVEQGGLIYEHIDNALFGEGNAVYSVHLNSENILYLQFPPYWKNFITNSSFNVYYLLSSGNAGKIGANVLDGVIAINGVTVAVSNVESSVGGYNPESVEEIRLSAPLYATTMDTLVTLEDINNLAVKQEGIADIVALDYNYPITGLVQPNPHNYTKNDAYKINAYVLPADSNSIYVPGETETVVHTAPIEVSSNLENRLLLFSFPDTLYSTLSDITDETILEYRNTDGILYYTMVLNNDSILGNCSIVLNNIFDNTSTTLYEVQSGSVTVNLTSLQLTGVYGAVTYIDLSSSNIVNTYIKSSYTETLPVETSVISNLASFINKRKVASVVVNYFNVIYTQPIITLKLYMNKDDLRYTTTEDLVRNFIVDYYTRGENSIGRPIYKSNLSAKILEAFPYLNYVEIVSMTGESNGMIPAGITEFLEVLPENINIIMVDYQE